MPDNRIGILFVSHSSAGHTGGQISLFNLVKRLDRSRFRATVLCPEPGPLTQFLEDEDLEIRFFHFPKIRPSHWAALLSAVLRFRRLAAQAGTRLVHTDTPRDTFLSALALLGTGIDVLWHARVSTRDPVFDWINPHLVRKIVCVSCAVARRFKMASAKTLVIYNGVDVKVFSPCEHRAATRSRLGLPEDRVIVTHIAQVIPEKGTEEYVQAASQVCKISREPVFLVVGVCPDESFQRRLAEMSRACRERILFLGYRPDVREILQASDVLVLPSWNQREGLPRVVIEAMACGLPVIGTRVEGIEEAVEEGRTGLLVPQQDVPALRDAVEHLVRDRELRVRLGSLGRRRAEELFDIRDHVARIERLYSELLATHTSATIP